MQSWQFKVPVHVGVLSLLFDSFPPIDDAKLRAGVVSFKQEVITLNSTISDNFVKKFELYMLKVWKIS